MKEARDIVLISFPFAAGVALAGFCPSFYLHLSLAAVAVLLLLALAGRLHSKGWYALMFLALGVLCGGAPLVIPRSASDEGIPTLALRRLSALIRSIPFAHEGTAPLLLALLTGQRGDLAPELVAAFRSAGASHILALSGLHLGIIYLILGKALALLGRSRPAGLVRSLLVVAACAFYALMTGAGPSIVRALLFICINEWLKHSPGRRRNPVAVWCCALMIQLAVSPWVIRSVGFQLSYLAMLGIVTVFPSLDVWFPSEGRRSGPVKRIWSAMALTVSCQLFTAPLVWLRFHSFPTHFLLTNLLALPLTSALMFCSVATLVLFAAGLCPALLIVATDTLAYGLQTVIGIIASF